jgi:small-conductance mechanosensitive channel
VRKAFILIYKQLAKLKEEYNCYRKEVKNTMKGEGSGGITQTDEQVGASVDYTPQSQNNNIQQMVPPIGERRKLFSEVVKNHDNNKRHRITLKPQETTTTLEQIKSQLKNCINPTGIKFGIKVVKTI